MGSKNRGQAQEALRALRRNEGNAPAAPSGYQSTDGRTLAQSGNDKAAYVWNAPFAEPLQAIGNAPFSDSEHSFPENSTDAHSSCFPPIDVADYRVLTIVMECNYVEDNVDAILELVPAVVYDRLDPGVAALEDFQDAAEIWTPLAFIKPDPVDVTAIINSGGGPSRSEVITVRTMGALALRTTPRTAPASFGTARLAMDFEVSSHRAFTISTLVRDGTVDDIESLRYYYTRRV